MIEGQKDAATRTAERMARGEPVGEMWLYGILACEMGARRLIDETTMRAYRSGAFFARRDIYGEKEALAWEAAAKADHEKAKQVWRTMPKDAFGARASNRGTTQ